MIPFLDDSMSLVISARGRDAMEYDDEDDALWKIDE